MNIKIFRNVIRKILQVNETLKNVISGFTEEEKRRGLSKTKEAEKKNNKRITKIKFFFEDPFSFLEDISPLLYY